jgi:hypothetical protein
MKIIDKRSKISNIELKIMAETMFGELVKAVVDVEKELLVVDAELHADEEKELLGMGSKQENLWGINLYPDDFGEDDFIEFDSMINLRPSWGNRSRGVDDEETQAIIVVIVNNLVED